MTDASRTTNCTVADKLAAAFRRHDVTIAFGQSIPTAFHLAAGPLGIRQVGYRTENAGGAMADGYARIANCVAVVTAQNGPAATLLVPPLAEALKASIPIVALVQEVPQRNAGRNAFQEIDHARLFSAVAKWIGRIEVPERVDELVDMAFVTAGSGRPGPVVLLVAADVLEMPAGDTPVARTARLGFFPVDRARADAARIDEAAALLADADAPLLVAGGGVHLSQAAEILSRIQEDCSLPVATTVMGKGAVAESHPLTLGVVGYFMAEGSRTHGMVDLVRRADVIMFVGTRNNQNGTDSWTLYPPNARYIHLDIDGTEVGRNYESLRLVGDARATLEAIHTRMMHGDLSKRAAARADTATLIANGVGEWRSRCARFVTELQKPIRPEQIMLELDALITANTIVVADASYSSIWIANYLTAQKAGQRFVTPRGLAGLGWGLPLAIGAQLAEPDARVVCVVGDGGFAHCWSELETLVRERLPITVLVLNNQTLGYQKHAETVAFGRHTDVVDFCPVDHSAIARACGCRGYRIEEPDAFVPTVTEALASGAPTLIEVMINEQAHPPITAFARKLQ